MTREQAQTLAALADAGVRALGIGAFAEGRGAKIQSALDALEALATQENEHGSTDRND